MCGIVGVIGSLGKPEKDALGNLIIADSLRGVDSTGIVSVGYMDTARLFKKAVHGLDFLQFNKTAELMNGKAVIAHNRWATRGAVNSVNAHPFQYGDFSGVHNGTLRNQTLLPDHKEFEVDSENVIYSFAKIGVAETIKKLDGAYALVWHNAKDQTISMVRNTERPLSYCFTEDRKHMYYASEAKMLEWVLARNNIKHKGLIECKPHQLYTFTIPKSAQAIEKTAVRKVKPYVAPVKSIGYNPSKPYGRGNQSTVTSINNEELQKYLGKTFEFQIGSLKYDSFKNPYLHLLPLEDITVNGRDIEIRMVSPGMIKELEGAREKGMHVQVQLSSLADNSRYPQVITALSQTIIVIPPELEEDNQEDAPFLFVGYEGELLLPEEWKDATKKGCAWCSSPADPKENNQFLAADEFLCESCKTLPMVKDYIDFDDLH